MSETQHTCAGTFDLSCEACQELWWEHQEEYPGESRHAAWLVDEPEEWDVLGGL
jgi:hypothetical protein